MIALSETELRDRALDTAAAATRRVKNRSAQVSRAFIRSDNELPPPVAKCLRGGRGGEVRLKLLLSLLWIAGGGTPPHDTKFPASAWAELLGLPEPYTKGVRRIQEAIRWLEKNRLVSVEQVAGLPSKITLLDDSGSGAEYSTPGKGAGRPYRKLPPEFWTQGWLVVLSGTSIAVLLILMDQQRQVSSDDIWLSPSWREKHYALSADTWTRATKELSSLGLVTVERKRFRPSFDVVRVRNFYTVNAGRLNASAFAALSA